MSRDSLRHLAAAVILTLAVLANQIVAPDVIRQSPLQTYHRASGQSYFYIVDLDTWRATERQRRVASWYDFRASPVLHDVPLQIGRWVGQDIEERNQEVFLILEPEQYVKRLYTLQDDPRGRYVWLYLIGSRKLKSFHHPDICYSAIEWQTSVSSEVMPLDEGEIYALKLVARNDREAHLSLYFFILPDDSYDESKGMVMFRVASPIWDGDERATVQLQKDFMRHFFFSSSTEPNPPG